MAFVKFDDVDSAQAIYSFFNTWTRTPTNPQGGKIEVQWGIDKSLLPETNWVAVVLRNLPPDSRVATVHQNCTSKGEKVKYVTKPSTVKGTLIFPIFRPILLHCCHGRYRRG